METTEKNKLLNQILWDYNISIEELDDVLTGNKNRAGHYTLEMLFQKNVWNLLLVYYNTIVYSKRCTIFIDQPNYQQAQITIITQEIWIRPKKITSNYTFKIDTPLNILSNKLTAVVGRDEPKDIFDIIHLSLNFSFNWIQIFEHAKKKAVINELDVEQRLASFPVEWLENVNWVNAPLDIGSTRKILSQIADDFLLGKPNSLGRNQTPIELAKPL